MTLREITEERERKTLSPFAALSVQSEGRLWPIEPCPIRTCYQRDIDRIVHSKAFRRLMHKTQVFLSPEGDHYRTRMTHTLEVARIARTICRGLRLNQDLAEAAAYGHDLGHTPFGHAGEKALSSMLDKPFRHNEQSLRVVDKLERDGAGLNLTYEVRMGILGHTGDFIPETLEGQIVRTSDRIAYINHDIDDAMRAGILTEADIPAQIAEILGHSHSQRINTLVENMISLYKDKTVNRNNATLIFTTHYCELLDLFNRQDNIYIAKSNDKVYLTNMYDGFNIRSELLKSRQFYNNVFRTAVNYDELMQLKKELKVWKNS